MGKTYFIGKSKEETVKVDLFYTENFIRPILNFQNIRLSQLEEIVAMKLEVVGNTSRKKDFWDLHELLENFSISQMLDFYHERYPYSYSKSEILNKLTDFSEADTDLDPICLKQKYWELINLFFIRFIPLPYFPGIISTNKSVSIKRTPFTLISLKHQ